MNTSTEKNIKNSPISNTLKKESLVKKIQVFYPISKKLSKNQIQIMDSKSYNKSRKPQSFPIITNRQINLLKKIKHIKDLMSYL